MTKKLALIFVGLFATNCFAEVFDPNIFVKLAKKIVPSVVNISTVSAVKMPFGIGRGTPDDFFRRFWGMPGGEDEDEGRPPRRGGPKAMALGTGFIIDESGLILTNNHVVAGADEIKINFTEDANEKPTDGEVVGRDPELDLALIRVKSKRPMTPVVFGDSDSLQVGEYVIAVGNPFGQGHSVTHGIISAKERKAPDLTLLANYLQTDAPINPGNSGGPLVNLKGEVIGINNAIDQRAQGIGFAIPISLVKKVLPQLRTSGHVARGYIGVLVGELSPDMSPDLAKKMNAPADLRAPFVTHVYPGEPAEKAGLRTYDIIVKFGDKEVHSSVDLIAAVTSVAVNEVVPVTILRAGQEKVLNIKVSQRPGEAKSRDVEPKKKKDNKKEKRPAVGMELEDLTSELARELGVSEKLKGVVVSSIGYGGAAEKAGLSRGDIILEVDRKPVKDIDDFFSMVKAKKNYLLRIRRPDPQGNDSFSVVILDLANTD